MQLEVPADLDELRISHRRLPEKGPAPLARRNGRAEAVEQRHLYG
jgi:hypothetical protein